MSKLLTFVLAVGAFCIAVYIVTLRRPLPEPARERGLRRSFLVAVCLFAALLTGTSYGQEGTKPPYKPNPWAARLLIPNNLKLIWRALDRKKSDEFGAIVQKAAKDGALRGRVASMLETAFNELSYHKYRKTAKVTCYKPSRMGMYTQGWRERALLQVETLSKAREAGKLDAATAEKALGVLAHSIERLHQARGLPAEEQRSLLRKLAKVRAAEVESTDSARTAAAMIVAMEGGKLPSFTQEKRFERMKARVWKLLEEGPEGNDWEDPDLEPNVMSTLKKSGLLPDTKVFIECYQRCSEPMPARTKELKTLQKELLNRNVKAGILPVEVAERPPPPRPAPRTRPRTRPSPSTRKRSFAGSVSSTSAPNSPRTS
ncbi:MAG: hypothetical protein ACYTFG_06305 [Planctomycetota bacterium]|jgi:hypothetical protein